MKRLPLLLALFTSVIASAQNYESTEIDSKVYRNRRIILPSAGKRVENGADAYLTADFLYFEAEQQGLQYATTASSASASGNANLSQGKSYKPDFKYEPGFRVGLGVGVGHDAWDVALQYSWYHQNYHKTSVTHTDNTIQTLTMSNNWTYNVGSPLTFASGEWKLRSSILDLELGRDSFFSPWLSIRPFVGLKASWQHQNYNTIYKWLDSSNGNIETTNSIPQNMKAFAIGMRSGANAIWSMNRNWSLYGNFALSTLFSRFKSDAKNTQTTTTSTLIRDNVASKVSAIQPVVELAFGLGWDVWFEDDAYHLGMRAGWEQQVWISNNYLLAPDTNSTPGDLSLQGFVLKLRFDF